MISSFFSLPDKPRVTTPSTFYTVQFGHNVTFYCSIAAVPAITNVSWLHNTTDRASVVTIDNNKYFSSIENPSLRIITATSEDIGWYICVGVNLAGETHSQPIYFNVSASKFLLKSLSLVILSPEYFFKAFDKMHTYKTSKNQK